MELFAVDDNDNVTTTKAIRRVNDERVCVFDSFMSRSDT